MSSPAGLLDFFVREASEYVDRLRTLLADALRHGEGAPDGDAFAKAARALRGAATMARREPLAELASSLERLGRETANGRIAWNPTLHRIAAAGVDDVRQLLSAARHWSIDDDSRARASAAEIDRVLPSSGVRATPAGVRALSTAFIADELESIARALAPSGRTPEPAPMADAAARARALRGVAGVDDLAPLGDIIDSVERAVTQSGVAIADAAARALERAAADLRSHGRPDPESPEATAFATRVAASRTESTAKAATAERIVPIETLFYADAGPHLVERGAGTTATHDARMRAELVSHGEHLRRLVVDARAASDPLARDRVVTALRGATRTLASIAHSYGAVDAARFFEKADAEPDPLQPLALASLDAAGEHLADRDLNIARLGARLTALARERTMAGALARGFAQTDGSVNAPAGTFFTPVEMRTVPPAARADRVDHVHQVERPERTTPSSPFPTPPQLVATLAASAPATSRSPTPTGRELHDLLSHGLEGLRELEHEPLSPPAALDDLAIVPIDALLYRGRAALVRAIELRDQIRSRGGSPDADTLGELFDLLDLAAE